jgi:hypothetical protein
MPTAARTQEDPQASYPEWTPAPVLSKVSHQYRARIFSLRNKGWQIANKVEVRDGVKHGYFRLATPRTFPNPQRGPQETKKKTTAGPQHIEPTHPATGSGLLFGDLPERMPPYPD